MLLLTILILSLLTAVNYRIGSKELLYPPVVFCATWTAALILVLMAGNFFYSVSEKTLSILIFGCICFSLGSFVACFLRQRQRLEIYNLDASNKIINCLLFFMLCSLPLVYAWISSIAESFSASNFFLSAYRALNAAYEYGEQSIIIGNLITLAPTVAMICVCERIKHGKRALFAYVLAFGITAMTGGRGAMVTMILGLISIEWMRTRKLSLKIIVPALAVLLIGVGALAILVHKGDATEEASISENIKPVAEGLVTYAAGGIPAFSQVVEQPAIIAHNWQIYNPVLLILNHLGAHFEVPGTHAEFLTIGPNNSTTNVYTIYFAYIDFGWPVAMLFICGIGFAVGLVYRYALSDRKIAIILYSYLFTSMLLSPFADFFFMGLNYSSKLIAVSWIVYALPVRWLRFCSLCSGSIASKSLAKPL